MIRIRFIQVGTAAFGLILAATAQGPRPLPGNPGNVFLAGQDVTVHLNGHRGSHWQAFEYGGRQVAQGSEEAETTSLGKLPVGYYTVKVEGTPRTISAGVVAPLVVRVPADSPLGLGGGAFFGRPREQWEALANLAALTGAGWEREFLPWQTMQPEKNGPIVSSVPDTKVEIVHTQGLKLLRLVQGIPAWTNHEDKRFPEDLRYVYTFYRELAARYRGKVQAFEPTNETDPDNTGAEQATFQKVAYLGLKAGNPNATVCSTAWSGAMVPLELREYHDNQASAYFDILDFHHYQPAQKLPERFDIWRQVADGKPMWATEFNHDPQPVEDESTGNPGPYQMRMQADLVAKIFVNSLFLGTQKAFYFTLPNYVENNNQFGALQADLTPRPAYLALAAVGRLLADGKVIGQLELPSVATAYAFHAAVDGSPRDVLVAWSDSGSPDLRLPRAPAGVFDVIGRPVAVTQNGNSIGLSQSPVFVVLSEGTVNAWASGRLGSRAKLISPPAPAPAPGIQPSPVVIQAVFSKTQLLPSGKRMGGRFAGASVVRLGGQSAQVRLFAYNFSDRQVTARLSVQVPRGWQYSAPNQSVAIPAMGRVPVAFVVKPQGGSQPGAVRITASGPGAGNSVLEFHVEP